MLILCAARVHCSFLHLQLAVSMLHLVPHVASACALCRRYQLATHKSPPCPASHRATNTIFVANDIGHDVFNRPSVVVSRMRPHLAHPSLFAPHIHVHLCVGLAPLLSPSPGPVYASLQSRTKANCRERFSSRQRNQVCLILHLWIRQPHSNRDIVVRSRPFSFQ
jgi:hypothetical protein